MCIQPDGTAPLLMFFLDNNKLFLFSPYITICVLFADVFQLLSNDLGYTTRYTGLMPVPYITVTRACVIYGVCLHKDAGKEVDYTERTCTQLWQFAHLFEVPSTWQKSISHTRSGALM